MDANKRVKLREAYFNNPHATYKSLAQTIGVNVKTVRKAIEEGSPKLRQRPLKDEYADKMQLARASRAESLKAMPIEKDPAVLSMTAKRREIAAERFKVRRLEQDYLVAVLEGEEAMLDARLVAYKEASEFWAQAWSLMASGPMADEVMHYLHTGIDPSTGKKHAMTTYVQNLERLKKIFNEETRAAMEVIKGRRLFDEKPTEYVEHREDPEEVERAYAHLMDLAEHAKELREYREREEAAMQVIDISPKALPEKN